MVNGFRRRNRCGFPGSIEFNMLAGWKIAFLKTLLYHFNWVDPIRQAFEINDDPVFGDICSEVGFARALELVLRLIP